MGDSDVVLIGIDDTDNLSSPGTGYLAQRLLESLAVTGLGLALGATRHQLLRDPRVPFTSHNSSACLVVEAGRASLAGPADVAPLTDHAEAAPLTDRAGIAAIVAHCADFLERHSADGSDPGLCAAPWQPPSWPSCPEPSGWSLRGAEGGFDPTILIRAGRATRVELRTQPQAFEAAALAGAHLSGHGGTHDGVIGALAAVGLHLSGEDGFFIWLPGLRSLRPADVTLRDILAAVPLQDARTADGRRPEPHETIRLHPWIRPVWAQARSVLLLVERDPADGGPRWGIASREVVRQY